MRLASCIAGGRPGYGVIVEGGVVDASRRRRDAPTLRAALAAGMLPPGIGVHSNPVIDESEMDA